MDVKDSKYRGLPFWSLNGKLDKNEIIKQVHVMKKMGFGGFFMHSRTGLETEYLGDEWFNLIKVASIEAEKLGLKAWLYDEDRWPSGTAGGLVTAKKENRLKFFSKYDITPSDYNVIKDDKDLLNVFAVKLDAKDELEEYYVYNGGEVNSDFKLVKIALEYMDCQDFYNGGAYLDTLNISAVREFLQSTHEKYKEKCGELFGKEIIGIFTDEPHRGAIMNGFGINNENKMNMMPATYSTCDVFFNRYGYSLKDRLVELYYIKSGERINKTMFDYINVTQDMFIENFAKPYHEWCKENKLILTGHVLHEDSLSIQTVFQGSVQRFYEYMDYPGVDILTEDNNAFWVAKQVQSVSRQLSKQYTLSEMYGATGWQLSFENHRDVGAWQALFGINLRCHHLSWYTMEGENKRDYPASILHQSGWYKDYDYIEDYFARANQILSEGKPVVDALVINPVESVWLYPRAGWLKNLFSPTVAEINELESEYLKLFSRLTSEQIDFDYGDEDILARHFSIIEVDGKTILKVGSAEYSTVILSYNHTIRQSTLNILTEFSKRGGKIRCISKKPSYVDAVKRENILPSVKITSMDDMIHELKSDIFVASGGLYSAIRKINEGYYLVLLNYDKNNGKNSKIEFFENFSVTEIKLDSDREIPLYSNTKAFETYFNKGEMRVFKLTYGEINTIVSEKKLEQEFSLDVPLEYTLTEDNVLPLDIPCFELGEEKFPKMEVLQADRTIRKKLGLKFRGGEMIQPWYRNKYLKSIDDAKQKLLLSHTFFVEEMPKKLTLAMEQSEKYTIKLNNKKVDNIVVGTWIDICFDKIVLDTSLLKIGENVLTLEVEFTQEVNLETVFLLGDVGVRIDNVTDKTLTKLPTKLEIGDISAQGLPFYSGDVIYYTGVKNKNVKVALGGCYGAYSKIMDDISGDIVAFAPYECEKNLSGELKILVSMTRRNTFGPLHLKGIYSSAYSPESFVEPQNYMEEYSLIPQGLLSCPKIIYQKKE